MIDEKKLITHIENQYREWGEEYDAEQILGDIEDFPKVGEWIPVEERLPDVYKTVLITTYNQEVRTAFLDGEHYWLSELRTYTFDDVLAWQPRPEPYEVKE